MRSPGHGGAGQTHGEQGFDLDPHGAGGLFHTGQGGLIRHPQAIDILHLHLAGIEAFLDLRSGAMHQHQPDAQAVQQGQVMDQIGKTGIGHRLAAQADHEGAVPVGVDIG